MTNLPLILLLALVLDSLVGDPQWKLHPVRLIGTAATCLENVCRRRIRNEFRAGIFTWLGVVLATVIVAGTLLYIARIIHESLYTAISVIFVYVAIAPRDLAKHALSVGRAVRNGDLPEARRRIGLMVSRDVSGLDRQGVVRAAIESTAENIVDGVTAPLFFAALLGPIGALLYRAINTMDAMFGYKNERYLHFGRFAAKADDFFSWLPARMTGPLVCLSAIAVRGNVIAAFRIMRRDHHKHESPNCGYTEAAVAGALQIRLGGPSTYFGTIVEKSYLGDFDRIPGFKDINRSIIMMYITTLLMVVIAVGLAFLKSYLLRGIL